MALTTCPFCACGCGLYLQTSSGKLIGVTPSEHHPVSRGRLCARGWAAHEASVWGERLTNPMIRRNGLLEPATWTEALAHATVQISRLRADGKAVGVLGSPRATNEENYLAMKLARGALGTNNIDFCLRAAYQPLLTGISDVASELSHLASLDDIERSELILLLEGDLANTHPRAALSVMEAVRAGARLVTLGTIRTQMSRLATIHLPLICGGERDIINGLLAGFGDPAFLDQSGAVKGCEGLEELRSSLASLDVNDEARTIRDWFASARRVVILMASTGTPHDWMRNNAAALTSLLAMTGHLDRPGSGLLPLVGRANFLGAMLMGVAPYSVAGSRLMHGKQAQAKLKTVWGKDLPTDPGLEASHMLNGVDGLIIVADELRTTLAAVKPSLDALEAMEFVVVLDSFATATAQVADVVLPITSFAETEGTYTSMEGRLQRVRAATEPIGDAKHGWEVLAQLINRFGGSASYRSAADVLHEIGLIASAFEGMTEQALEEGVRFETVGASNERKPVVQVTKGEQLTSSDYPFVLVREGSFDWGADPLVAFSPTLRRDFVSRRKLFPNGVVEMNQGDLETLGARHGWTVKLASKRGEIELPATVRKGLERGVILLPVMFRDCVSGLLGSPDDGAVAVTVERV